MATCTSPSLRELVEEEESKFAPPDAKADAKAEAAIRLQRAGRSYIARHSRWHELFAAALPVPSWGGRCRSSRLSLSIADDGPEELSSPLRWPTMSISRTDSDLSFALNLSISEQNLQRMVRAPSASWPASPGAGVSPGMRRKTVKLKVGVRGSSLAVSPRPAKRSSRAAVLLFLLLRVVTFAAAAAAALALARGFSRGTAPSGPLGGAGRPAALGGGGGWRRSGGGAAMALDIGELVAAAEGASSAAMFLGREAGAVLDYAALDLNLETVLHGASLLKGAGSLKAGAGAIAGSAALHRARSASWVGDVAAEVGEQLEATAWAMPAGSPPGFGLPAGQVARLQRLRAHLSPLSQLTPLSEPADCFDGDAAPETFPRTPVAAAGMLGAVLLAVASPGVAAGGGPAVAGEGGGGEEGGGEEGRETSSRRYVVPALPAGFDLSHATACAQLSGFAYSMNGSRVDLAALRARLAGVGMELVDAIEVEEHFAYIARRGGDVFLAFRGSCNGKNVLTDLDYHACSASLASFERESGLELPAGIALHRGFLAGWASLREAVLPSVEAALRAAALRDRPAGGAAGVARLHVTGHSMGGAIGQLASWEIAQIAQRRQRQRGGEQAGPTDTHGTTARHDTYTFAAPRVGNCKFARSFGAVCGRDHWALQAASDAVPHLPFHAWGFRHPEGVLKLGDGAAAVERSGDVGDDPVHVRPKDGNWLNWALAHDMEYYMRRLAELGGPTASLEEGVTFSA